MNDREYDYTKYPDNENVVVQVRQKDGSWLDYSRCTIAQARGFLRKNDGFRMVDWIWKDVISE